MKIEFKLDQEAIELIPENHEDAQKLCTMAFLCSCSRIEAKNTTKTTGKRITIPATNHRFMVAITLNKEAIKGLYDDDKARSTE